MFTTRLRSRRRGSILPLMVISLVALCGCVALAVDVGLILAARTQCQNAADAAALAGTRALDGAPDSNLTAAVAKAMSTAEANKVLSRQIQAFEVAVQAGAYHYDPTAQTFSPQYPPVAPDNYNLMQVTVTHRDNSAFAGVFGIFSFQVSASSTGAHRPRDVAIVLDYSGSMNNESDLWNNESYLGSANNSPNNTDPVVPAFGAYSSASAGLQCTSSDPRVGKCNITQTVLGVAPLVNNFYQNGRGASTGTPAFNNVAYTNLYTPPSGDQYLAKKNTSTTPPTFAVTVADITGATAGQITAKTDPPMPSYTNFNGYTQGPGYWGTTFFIWPPDPDYSTAGSPSSGVNAHSTYPASLTNPPRDWRRRFFLKTGGSYPSFGGQLDDNTLLWDAGGNWKDPPGNYVINYRAILAWIQASCVQANPTDPKPFPPTLRAGNILYYDAVPNDVPVSAYNHSNSNDQITDPNQRFWKEYIDYVIGVWRDPYSNSPQHPQHPACSIGPDFAWGTTKVSAPVAGYAATPTTRMHPQDNPLRPRHRLWFGPMTMVQYMSDTGLLPGTAQDISMVAAKLGIQGALTDIENNHPNDLVSMLLFSRPHYNGEPAEVGSFSAPQFSLSRDYAGMINALWFPPNSTTLDVRPWDVNGTQTPRAHGDYVANTATSYGFMLAYNQFSSSSTLRALSVGGLGRKGAQRLVILETDGMANQATQQSFTLDTTNLANSFYNVRPGDTVNTSANDPGQDAIDVATRICAATTDTVNGPGFSTPTRPVILHCVAFGAVFEPTASGSEPARAMALLQQLSAIGGTGFPSSVTATSDPNFYKLCTGTLQQRQDKLRQAFSRVMDDGVSVILVQ